MYAHLTEAQLRCRLEPEKGVFIVESEKVIRVALAAGWKPLSFLAERKYVDTQVRALCEGLGEVPVYTAEREVLAGLTGYALTRGVLCAMRRPVRMPSVEEVIGGEGDGGRRRVVVLDGVVNSENTGAIFRAAAALGMDAVLLTRTCCDPLNRRACRVSMGTVFQVPWTFIGESAADWPEKGMSRLHALGFKTCAMALTDDSISMDSPLLMSEEKLAIILGTEGTGLKKETIAASDFTVKIPMANGVDSLNVGAAAAIAFWQLTR